MNQHHDPFEEFRIRLLNLRNQMENPEKLHAINELLKLTEKIQKEWAKSKKSERRSKVMLYLKVAADLLRYLFGP